MRRRAAVAMCLALAVVDGAQAKDRIGAVAVCGAHGCNEVRDGAAGAATLTYRLRERAPSPAPFYDVMVVWSRPDGGRHPGPALRYVPSARAVRTWQGLSERPLWFRTDRTLGRLLDAAARGLAPRSRADLDAPRGATGGAATAFRRRLAGAAAARRRPAGGPDGSRPPLGAVLIAVAGTAGLLVVVRTRRRGG